MVVRSILRPGYSSNGLKRPKMGDQYRSMTAGDSRSTRTRRDESKSKGVRSFKDCKIRPKGDLPKNVNRIGLYEGLRPSTNVHQPLGGVNGHGLFTEHRGLGANREMQ